MPQNGYWIECIPLLNGDMPVDSNPSYNSYTGRYRASIASIPEARAFAESPEKAIQLLRDKLATLRHDYCCKGKTLPEHDNPVVPPRAQCKVNGWISVYVQMAECCQMNANH